MRLSAPIFRLKRRAKMLAREKAIPLNQALKSIAAEEGFNSWSLLASKVAATSPAREILAALTPGDMVLLGARPGHGKSKLSLTLISEAIKSGRYGAVFTFEYNDRDILKRMGVAISNAAKLKGRFTFDTSDYICADYIIRRLRSAPRAAVVVIDYLQLLDQKRSNPDLMTQVRALKKFATERGLIIVCISQIDRSFDPLDKMIPSLEDVRLPNPLDLMLFDKACFVHDGEIGIESVR